MSCSNRYFSGQGVKAAESGLRSSLGGPRIALAGLSQARPAQPAGQRAFAVVATKEEPSTSGSAICISHLTDVWPEMSERVFAGSIAYRHIAQRVVEVNQTEPRVSSPPAELAQLDIRATKRRVKEGEFGALLRDWEDTVKRRSAHALA